MPSDGRTPEQIRREIETERELLANAVEELREEMGEATNITAKLRANLPIAAAGALGAGFVLSGGVGATMRLLYRRGREGTEKARFGRFILIDRD
jgi:Protein of unknown function (DUF3618)